MRDVREEGGNLPLGVVGRPDVAETRVGAGRGQEGVALVETLASASSVSLADDPVEEALRHDTGDGDVVGARRSLARPGVAPGAAVVVAGAAVAPAAAAKVGGATAVLGGGDDDPGSTEA